MASKKPQPSVALRKLRPVRGPGALISTTTVRIVERRFQVVTLRREGYTVQEIADVLGISTTLVRLDIQETLNQTITETAETTEENRQLQIERLDGLIKELIPLTKAQEVDEVNTSLEGGFITRLIPPSIPAALAVASIEAQRAKLLALNVPEVKRLEVSGVREYVGVDVDQV